MIAHLKNNVQSNQISARMSQSQIELLIVLTTQISNFFNQISEICIRSLTYDENNKQNMQQKKVFSEDPPQKKKQNIQDLQSNPAILSKSIKKNDNRKKTKKKQPGMPKIPPSSYLMYFHQNRKQLQAKYGTNCLSVITKMASKDWSQLPPEQKQKYLQRSALQQQNYRKLMVEFKKKAEEQKSKQALKKAKTEKKENKKQKLSSSSQKKKKSSSSSSSSSISSSKSSRSIANKMKQKKTSENKNTSIIQIASSISSHQTDSLGQIF